MRKRARVAGQLQPRLLEMVRIKMTVAAGPDEHARLKPAFTGEHVSEQRIAGDVERHAEEDVGAALIELEVEPPARDLGLEQAMAGGERHFRNLARIPGGHDLPARIGIAPDQL